MIVHALVSMPPGRTSTTDLTRRAMTSPETRDTPREPVVADPVLAAYLAGDPDATDRLVAAYGTVVRDAITRFLAVRARGRMELADDLTHEVFLALFREDGRKLRTFAGRDGCSFAGWLKVVAVRLTIDRLRREARVVALDDDTPRMLALRRSLRSEEADPEVAMQGVEAVERLGQAMAQLNAKDRVLAELHLVRGRSLEHVAEVLGVTMNAAYVRKSRLMERLRKMLGEDA